MSTIDTSVVPKIESVADLFNSGVFVKIRAGAENTLEISQKTGSDKLVRNAEQTVEKIEEVILMFKSLLECCDEYKNYISSSGNELS